MERSRFGLSRGVSGNAYRDVRNSFAQLILFRGQNKHLRFLEKCAMVYGNNKAERKIKMADPGEKSRTSGDSPDGTTSQWNELESVVDIPDTGSETRGGGRPRP